MGRQAGVSYPPAAQDGVQLLQSALPDAQDRLPRRRVVEQVLQVSQRQLRLGLHRLLDTHLPPGAAFLLLSDKSHDTTAFSLNPRRSEPRTALRHTHPLSGQILGEPVGDEFNHVCGLAPATQALQQLAVTRRRRARLHLPQLGQDAAAGGENGGARGGG